MGTQGGARRTTPSMKIFAADGAGPAAGCRDNLRTGLLVATVARIDADGCVWVEIDGAAPRQADIAVPWGALGDNVPAPRQRVLVLHQPPDLVLVAAIHPRAPEPPARIQLEATERLSLRCGEASVDLTADGWVELRGEEIDSHAEGVQRIRGAQVRIN